MALATLLAACSPDGGGTDADGSSPGAADALPDAVAPTEAAGPDAAPPAPPGYRFPIHAEDRALIRRAPVFHVDHDDADGNRVLCTNYRGDGFPGCYDGHDGTDFLLDGAFVAMDAGSARVVAAAPGTVVAAEDGHYDRCHGSLDSGDVDCDGHPVVANHVVLRHSDGRETLYWHLKQGSVAVGAGDEVGCADLLGLVGSSGYSTVPHLHFEVHDAAGQPLDPFAGERSQPDSLWSVQEAGDGLPADRCPP